MEIFRYTTKSSAAPAHSGQPPTSTSRHILKQNIATPRQQNITSTQLTKQETWHFPSNIGFISIHILHCSHFVITSSYMPGRPLHCTALLHSALDNATITLSQSLSIVMNVVTSTSTFHFYPEYQAAQTLARYWCNLYSCRYYLDILVILPLSGLERWPEATDTEAAGHCPSWWRLGGIMAPIVHQPPAQHQPAEGWGEVRPHQSQHIVTQYILS